MSDACQIAPAKCPSFPCFPHLPCAPLLCLFPRFSSLGSHRSHSAPYPFSHLALADSIAAPGDRRPAALLGLWRRAPCAKAPGTTLESAVGHVPWNGAGLLLCCSSLWQNLSSITPSLLFLLGRMLLRTFLSPFTAPATTAGPQALTPRAFYIPLSPLRLEVALGLISVPNPCLPPPPPLPPPSLPTEV